MENCNIISSYYDYEALKNIIRCNYHIDCSSIELLREMIGFVFKCIADNEHYIFKLYRQSNYKEAINSLGIMQYLQSNGFPSAPMIFTKDDKNFVNISTPEGNTIGALTKFISGLEPDIARNIENVGKLTGRMHKLMQSYPGRLIERDKDFYIVRYINLLSELSYDKFKVREMELYGNELWTVMQKQPKAFCHGDLHSGNMLQEENGRIVLFDFDVAGKAYSVIDAATLCNRTGFNNLKPDEYCKTIEMFENFCQGYKKHQDLTNLNLNALLAFIAIRHYELIATITESRKDRSLSNAFLDEQFNWLMQWREICSRS